MADAPGVSPRKGGQSPHPSNKRDRPRFPGDGDLTRRTFIRGGVVVGLGAGPSGWLTAGSWLRAAEAAADPVAAAAGAAASDRARPGIVDTHQHLWDLSRFRLAWLDSAAELKRSFGVRDYLEAAAGLCIEQAVYMEVDVAPGEHAAEAEHVLAICRAGTGPTRAAVIGGRPGDDGFRQYAARFRDEPRVKGVRQVLYGSPGLCLTDRFVESLRLLGEMGRSFDLCLPPERLSEGVALADRCPDTLLVLDHCGNADPKAFRRRGGDEKPSHDPDAWRRDIDRLAAKKNVVCKISGIVARLPRGGWTPDDLAPVVDGCLDAFGPDRVAFGSDWPVCTRGATLREWVEALEVIVRRRGPELGRKLFRDNAIRIYRLAGEDRTP